LKEASPLQLAKLMAQGTAATGADQDCLARMGLERPSTPMEWLYALLLKGALKTARRYSEHQGARSGAKVQS
jgi:hypothetical protein